MVSQLLLLSVLLLLIAVPVVAASVRVEVNSMPRIVFTGDSQTCGRVGALDYPQMLSWELPLRVFNTAVGGSGITHLLQEKSGGTAVARAGETVVEGEKVGWGSSPYPGQKIRLGKQEYVIDRIEMLDYKKLQVRLHLTEPVREDFSGTDFGVEPGWRVRIAEVRPDYACFMYSVNDSAWTSEDFTGYVAEVTRRCRESGITPLFLSGYPYMDAESGGSHPGSNSRVLPRPQDLQEFCAAEKLPFGDVFRTLMLLDEQRVTVWADTVHPTTDGSWPAVEATRSLLQQLGALQPYYVRGHRAAEATLPELHRERGLKPITTSQPDYNAKNEAKDNDFDLAAIKARDEYGLLAEADGDCLTSATPVILELGTGPVRKIDKAQLELVVAGPVEVLCWAGTRWQPLCAGQGKLQAEVPAAVLTANGQLGPLWLGVQGEQVAVDHVALNLTGDLQMPAAPVRSERALVWPAAGAYDWPTEGNLFPNGDLTQAAGEAPQGWQAEGTAQYLPAGVVLDGKGEFTGPRLNQFLAPGQHFTTTLRPLDMVQIAEGPEGTTGNFLISQVLDDERLQLRRAVPSAANGLTFSVRRSSGCKAVPGGCVIETGDGGKWRTGALRVPAGRYTLGYSHRVFEPATMTASSRPNVAARLTVSDAAGKLLQQAAPPATYGWQRFCLNLELNAPAELAVEVGPQGEQTVQWTGFTLKARR